MGVLSDLSGQSHVEKKDLKEREFLEFDMDNFDKRMAAIAPRVAFNADNTLEGEGKLGIDLTFSKMDDFDPGAIAKNVPALKKLLEARNELNDLLVFMDGKAGAQKLIDEVLKNPDLLKAISAAKQGSEEGDAATDGDDTEKAEGE